MRFGWDDTKAAANMRKHGVSFETALRVFLDQLNHSVPDPHPDGDRWTTLGVVDGVVLRVTHTMPDWGVGRIISARKATPHERRDYEFG